MKLFLNKQVYFLASVLLHAGIFLFLVFSSYSFSRNNDTFEASVLFETPKPPVSAVKPQKITKPDKPVQTDKPLSAPRLKSPTKTDSTPGGSFTPSVTSKRLDDILKKKTTRVEAEDKPVEPVVEKKSDLLGYLRATKRTKENVETPQTEAKPVKPLQSTAQEEKKPAGQSQPAQPTPPQAVEKASGSPQTGEQQKTEGESVSQTPVTKKPSALNIWRKKTDVQSYRNVLRKLVTANWTVPPVSVKTFQIIIEATINKNGDLVGIQLLESSGLAILDAAAERAIRVSTPFPSIPATVGEDETTFTAIFRFTPDQEVY